tara:strand:- start:159 stop:470 length:312 start_codon:yes stop_codon:yes gene_type:complete
LRFINYLFILFFFISIQESKSGTQFDLGKKIFLEKGNCVTCHTLADTGSQANIGPNLDEIRPDLMRVIVTVTNGIGVMPAYDGQLSTEEIKAVAEYVSEIAGK